MILNIIYRELRALAADVIADGGFTKDSQREPSDWERVKAFVGNYATAGEQQDKMKGYREKLSQAKDYLLVRRIKLLHWLV